MKVEDKLFGNIIYILSGILLLLSAFTPWLSVKAYILGTRFIKYMPLILNTDFSEEFLFIIVFYFTGFIIGVFKIIFSFSSILLSIFIAYIGTQSLSNQLYITLNLETGFWFIIISSILSLFSFSVSKGMMKNE